MIDNWDTIRPPNHRLDTTKAFPNVVWGDFDGNGQTDYAFFIAQGKDRPPKKAILVAYMTYGNRLKKFVIDSVSAPVVIADLIWLSPKGSREYDYETNRFFRLKHDAILAITIDKAVETFIFQGNQFLRITTAD